MAQLVLLAIAIPGVGLTLVLSVTGPHWAYLAAGAVFALTFWTASIALAWAWLFPWGRRRRITRGKRALHIGIA